MASNTTPMNQGIEILEGLFGRNDVGQAITPNERNLRLQYWKNCEGCKIHKDRLGWVVVAPALGELTTADYYIQLNHKHRKSLESYGKWLIGSTPANNGFDLTIPEHRFDALIMAGGLHEIPIEQMIAYNWHRKPTIVKYVPELANVVDYECEYCNKKFNNKDGIQKHTLIWHKDVAQPKAIGQEISRAIEAVSANTNTTNSEQIAAIVAAVVQAMKDTKE